MVTKAGSHSGALVTRDTQADSPWGLGLGSGGSCQGSLGFTPAALEPVPALGNSHALLARPLGSREVTWVDTENTVARGYEASERHKPCAGSSPLPEPGLGSRLPLRMITRDPPHRL